MKNNILNLIILGLLSACATVKVIDEKYTSTDPDFSRNFSNTTYDKCQTASVRSLKEMGIAVDSQKKGEIITNRYEAYKYAQSNGYVSQTGSVNGTTVVRSQQVKAYLKVNKIPGGCEVKITRVRAWENNREFETLNVGFTKTMFVQPFFKELEERIN